MKIAVKFLTYGLLLTAFLAFTSCDKEGPQGPAGIAGTNGTNGTNGQDGQDGSANIIASDWSEAAWTFQANGGFYETNVPAITQEILDHGVIMVYLKLNAFGTDLVRALPISFETSSYWFSAYEGILNISFSADEPLTIVTLPFRYIIIPTTNTAGKSSSSGKGNVLADLKAKGVDINDYYAMMDYLGKDY